MISTRTLILPLAFSLGVVAAHAQGDTFHITPEEQAACMDDATRLCSAAYPDETKLLTCMRQNMHSLTGNCAVVFKAGLKRRHMS